MQSLSSVPQSPPSPMASGLVIWYTGNIFPILLEQAVRFIQIGLVQSWIDNCSHWVSLDYWFATEAQNCDRVLKIDPTKRTWVSYLFLTTYNPDNVGDLQKKLVLFAIEFHMCLAQVLEKVKKDI